MDTDATTVFSRDIMREFAALTGLEPPGTRPNRYLWTDAFAVCTYLALFRRTNDRSLLDRALRLVNLVHRTLGRHRDDDPRDGWISGLSEREGALHPTLGGLRIGKRMNERGADEPPDAHEEWNRDGQYYHYLTKWMHALARVAAVTRDPVYLRWAMELAKAAHAAFTYALPSGGGKRMCWKMSIDLSRTLVPSMGQHDPLDGLVTYAELQGVAARDFGGSVPLDLLRERADAAAICRGMPLVTDDPLGIGGLLFDATRIAHLMEVGGFGDEGLLESVMDSAMIGLESYTAGRTLDLPAQHRLAFRELGLAIGITGVAECANAFGRTDALERRAEALVGYMPLGDAIEGFWMDERNRQARTWIEHTEINMVMLAARLAPDEFLRV
ncbi:MAG: hypothetical protein QCH35_03490 [Methanomicrobiaceae archaeon]|nr:hypothetical protein [Methanomicrobiaceae archaeon]